jgi:hypothetical protein
MNVNKTFVLETLYKKKHDFTSETEYYLHKDNL